MVISLSSSAMRWATVSGVDTVALLALLIAPVAGPMIAFLPTRRRGISAFVWAGTVGLHRRRDLDALIDAYVQENVAALKSRLLPAAIDVLHRHREQGDTVLDLSGGGAPSPADFFIEDGSRLQGQSEHVANLQLGWEDDAARSQATKPCSEAGALRS